jgi:hypothetical protein
VQESYDDIRDLHSGVVDVVLDIYLPASESQQTHEGVSQDCIAEVANVGSLVGIDARVLDEHFSAWDVARRLLVSSARLARALM